MNFNIIPDEEALDKCAFCRERISEEMEVFAVGVKLKPNIDLAQYQSHCIEIHLAVEKKPVPMMVTAEGSEAKNAGNDALFMVCSESCGRELSEALKEDISTGELLEEIQDTPL